MACARELKAIKKSSILPWKQAQYSQVHLSTSESSPVTAAVQQAQPALPRVQHTDTELKAIDEVSSSSFVECLVYNFMIYYFPDFLRCWEEQ